MLVRDFIDKKAVCIKENVTMREAAELFVYSKASDLIVVNDDQNIIGVLSEGDLLRAMMPNVEELVKGKRSMDEIAQLFIKSGFDLAKLAIKKLIIREPITVHVEDSLIKAATIMIDMNIRCLPVVEQGKYVGSISRADICWVLTL